MTFIRRHVLGFAAIFLALSASAYAAEKLPKNSVTTTTVKNRSLKGGDLAKGTIKADNLAKGSVTAASVDLVSMRTLLQERLKNSCAEGQAMRGVAADGTVTCTPVVMSLPPAQQLPEIPELDTSGLQNRVTGTCSSGGSIRAIAVDGSVDCQAPPTIPEPPAPDFSVVQKRVAGSCSAGETIKSIAADGTVQCQAPPATDFNSVQKRVTGTCSTTGSNGIQSLGADGTVSCGNLQNRVTGSCSGTAAVQSVTSGGGVNCSANLVPASRVLVSGVTEINAGDTVTLVDAGSGVLVTGKCPSGPVRAEIEITSTGGNLNIFSWSAEDNSKAAGPTTALTIASTVDSDTGTFDFGGLSGAVNGRAGHGQYYAFTGNSKCQFSASTVTT